jgi:hypothetical protein
MHLLCLVCMAGARLVPSPNSCVCMHLDLGTHTCEAARAAVSYKRHVDCVLA